MYPAPPGIQAGRGGVGYRRSANGSRPASVRDVGGQWTLSSKIVLSSPAWYVTGSRTQRDLHQSRCTTTQSLSSFQFLAYSMLSAQRNWLGAHHRLSGFPGGFTSALKMLQHVTQVPSWPQRSIGFALDQLSRLDIKLISDLYRKHVSQLASRVGTYLALLFTYTFTL